MIRLSNLRDAFEGIIPSVVGTVDAQGIPNVSYLSHVYYVDDSHVAMSNQYFSKTIANVRSQGVATVLVLDARTGQQYMLDLSFKEALDSGPIFERMDNQLDVISELHGFGAIMKLKTADIYQVTDCRPVDPATTLEPPPAPRPRCDRMGRAAALGNAISALDDADAILDATLDGLAEMGFGHVMVLVPDAGGTTLSTIASRGYRQRGAGAEIVVGDGLIGRVAKSRRPIRIADMRSAVRYAASAGGEGRSIPLPGLKSPQCQLAVPMLARGRLRGVIFAESETSFAFDHDDEQALAVVAGQLAAALMLAELASEEAPARDAPACPERPDSGRRFRFRYFAHDDSVFIDDDYVIKGVAGRLLYHFVRCHAESGRCEFANREIRRETALKLPDLKDNLETRLILLRQRLEDKQGPVRLVRPERGQLRLLVDGRPEIEVVESA